MVFCSRQYDREPYWSTGAIAVFGGLSIPTRQKHEIMKEMTELTVLNDEFFSIVLMACSNARAAALRAGHSVVYRDEAGRYVEERPGGNRFEIRFDKTRPRESHIVVLRELTANAA